MTEGTTLKREPSANKPHAHFQLERAIGVSIRELRLDRGLTVAKLADASQLSIGMLSKIENGMTSPSLKTLLSLSVALNVPVTMFFRRFDSASEIAHVTSEEIDNKAEAQAQKSLDQIRSSSCAMASEAFVVRLTDPTQIAPTIRQNGIIHIHMRSGSMAYAHGETEIELAKGDFLMIDSSVAHGVVNLIKTPVEYLVTVTSQTSALQADIP